MSAPGPHEAEAVETPRTAARVAKDIALFFAAPFITMACLACFPFIAFSELRKARQHRKEAG
jgi:hypothetical protein